MMNVIVIAQDTMYIHQNGGVITKIAINKIDSVIFYASKAPGVLDVDGNAYNTVVIGAQTWMQGNLKVTRFNDTKPILPVTDASSWSTLTTPAYCWYNNDLMYKNIYGALYNWYTVDNANLCPTGWHVPTDAEWTTLYNFLATDIGGKMKELGIAHWKTPNEGATNSSGFTALPGGFRDDNGVFNGLFEKGYWWSATESSSTYAWYRSLNYLSVNASRGTYSRKFGYSVRCLKN